MIWRFIGHSDQSEGTWLGRGSRTVLSADHSSADSCTIQRTPLRRRWRKEKKGKKEKGKKRDETNLNGGRICVLHDIQRFFFFIPCPLLAPSLSRSGGWKVGGGKEPHSLSPLSLSLSSLSQNLNTFSGEGREGWQRTVTVS